MISEVQSRGSTDEFVELVNPTCSEIDLSGWKIDYRTASLASTFGLRAVIPAGTHLGPGHHYLITGAGYDAAVAGDLTLSSAISDAGVLRLLTPDSVLVDAVGYYYNTTTFNAVVTFSPEGTPINNLPHNDSSIGASNSDVSVTRRADVQDTNDNLTDFTNSTTSSPESSQGPPLALLDCSPTGVDPATLRLSFRLAGMNPFHESTVLECSLPQAERVRIELFSVDGRRVATLIDHDLSAGRHLFPFELHAPGRHDIGAGISQGEQQHRCGSCARQQVRRGELRRGLRGSARRSDVVLALLQSCDGAKRRDRDGESPENSKLLPGWRLRAYHPLALSSSRSHVDRRLPQIDPSPPRSVFRESSPIE